MTPFAWKDRNGVNHQLTSPAPIDAEGQSILGEIDVAMAALAVAPGHEMTRLRNDIRLLTLRLRMLQEDAARWNEHSAAANATAASVLVANIDRLEASLGPLRLVVALHKEILDLLDRAQENPRDQGNQSITRDAMTGPMTEVQIKAIAASDLTPKPPKETTMGEAHDWLQCDPTFCRKYDDAGGWFEWLDYEGHARRLSNPLPIEVEVCGIADELQDIRKQLVSKLSHHETARLIVEANDLSDRISELKGDLERFTVEANEREEEEWSQLEKAWNSDRTNR